WLRNGPTHRNCSAPTLLLSRRTPSSRGAKALPSKSRSASGALPANRHPTGGQACRPSTGTPGRSPPAPARRETRNDQSRPPLTRSSSAESAMPAPLADTPASEADLEAFKASVLAKLTLAIGKDGAAATPRDWFVATALALRDRVIHRWLAVNRLSHAEGRKRVYYLSLEFLIGRLFADVVENLRMTETVKAALGDLGVDLDKMRRAEPDAALGNGGLGRLAACLMESMASLGIPARGYGIRYDHGLFRQVIRDGWQMEFAENWLSFGNPWEFARPEFT